MIFSLVLDQPGYSALGPDQATSARARPVILSRLCAPALAAHDDLVAWAWRPGEGREPAPGTQELFGQLIQAWIDTGAQCP
jgi:hypothetical protein